MSAAERGPQPLPQRAATPPEPDVVETAAEAAALRRPPLLVLEPLAAYLDREGLGAGPLAATPIGEGHSNVTFLIERGGDRLVLRRPPRPPLPPSAHDVVREARLQRALAREGVRVPRILAICEDPAVIGMPFYVMEHVDAHVAGPTLPAPLAVAPDRRAAFAVELVDALAELHAVDINAAGLDWLGRRSGYLGRQLRRFSGLWADNRTRDMPEMDRVTAWLQAHVPAAEETTVVHGDYRLGNAMFVADPLPRLRAILDWELATLGDPLADIGYLVAMWAEPGDEETPMSRLSAVTRLPGFPGRAALRERYASRTGRALDDLRFYEVLALWKSAVFLECSYARYLAGTTDDPYFATLGEGVPTLIRAALRRATDG